MLHTEKITLVVRGYNVAEENEQEGQGDKPAKKDERFEMLCKASN